MNAVFQFILTDDDNFWVDVEDGRATFTYGDHNEPSVTVSTTLPVLIGVLDGSKSGIQSFMMGKLKAEGDVALGQKMTSIFKMGD